jgi:hypothetical protein
MDTAKNFCAFQRFFLAVFFTHRHQRRHFCFGDIHFHAAPGSKGNISDFVIVFQFGAAGLLAADFLATAFFASDMRHSPVVARIIDRLVRKITRWRKHKSRDVALANRDSGLASAVLTAR